MIELKSRQRIIDHKNVLCQMCLFVCGNSEEIKGISRRFFPFQKLIFENIRQIARQWNEMKFIRLIKSKIGKLNRHNDWKSINYDQIPFNFLNWFNFLPSVMPRHFSSSKLPRCEQFNFVFSHFFERRFSSILWWKMLINYNFQLKSWEEEHQ